MNPDIKFLETAINLITADSDKQLTPILSKQKIIPIRSGIALKIEEKQKKLLADQAQKQQTN